MLLSLYYKPNKKVVKTKIFITFMQNVLTTSMFEVADFES